MNVFEVHRKVIADYEKYIRSFITISDEKIKDRVDHDLMGGKLWPEPLLQFNPSFAQAGKVADLARDQVIHRDVADVFKDYSLYQHQLEALKLGVAGKDFIVTSGTGSGKSLTYIGTIFSHLLKNPASKGVVAVVVYPLNALINSQTDEFDKYQRNYKNATGKDFPISYGQYTGQENDDKRNAMRENPPQILLTNYMMLELLLTRLKERSIRDAIYDNLKYLVFDELHTYRGRQGADVAMLIRRIRAKCKNPVTCIGTSATMVSGGTIEEQRIEVASVASKLFGKPYETSQVIIETLAPSLEQLSTTKPQLAKSITEPISQDGDVASLKRHPVACWLESNAALDNQIGILVRRRPKSVKQLSQMLSEQSGIDATICYKTIESVLLWISRINEEIQKRGSRETVLPFRLHQFVSQTGSVYTTLDQGDERFVTLEPGIYKSDDSNQKPIFPNVFSRTSGHPFICVTRVGNKLLPREFSSNSPSEYQGSDGYLIVGDLWNPVEDLEYLPDTWFQDTKKGRRPKSEYEDKLPQKIFFDELGNCSSENSLKYEGWFMSEPLLFDPTSGTFFDNQTRESTKLAKLGSEGRSTSTTIMAFAILNQLKEAGYKPSDQKLLSFTDNRQDAALQAGHFNDFLQVIQLRSAIFKALKAAPNNQLTSKNLGESIFNALDLGFTEFATRQDVPEFASVRKNYEHVFQNFLVYRALGDLRRSWRIVLPNLEQCALLRIDYENLDEVAEASSFWQPLPHIAALDEKLRYDFISNILDFFRLEFAIHSANYLEPSAMRQNENDFIEKLREPWTLERDEKLDAPTVIRLDRLSPRSPYASASMGPSSALGKYIKQFAKSNGWPSGSVTGENYRVFIHTLMDLLVHADYLHRLQAKSNAGDEIPTYRLKVDKIIWKLGDCQSVKPDVIKTRSFRESSRKPNAFFMEMYRNGLPHGKRLRAEDHTGQLDKETRMDREERFKCDWKTDGHQPQSDLERILKDSISALFCSPTMELGVDIGGLSVVHMRNVPPNSANYAQRSGRAGRSGQGALVFTYCSTFSPHDRHYFNEQAELVAGAVHPPKLDLCNKDLLSSHLNALAISEIGLPGIDGIDGQGGKLPSLLSLVNDDSKELPLKPEVRKGLSLSGPMFDQIKATFKQAIYDFRDDLDSKRTGWYNDTWIDTNLAKIADHLDQALGRWRILLLSAKTAISKATNRLEPGLLITNSPEFNEAQREVKQATTQKNILENQTLRGSSELSEFYPYRYLAAEGFLPGYNFTRLPVRVFLQEGRRGDRQGEYVSRPRFVALREFAPRNIIYHNGRKYRIEQLVAQDIEQKLTTERVSNSAGYLLSGDQKDSEICPFTSKNLSDSANRTFLNDLIELAESRASEIDRISCEEEERSSRGFDVSTYFSVDGSMDSVRIARVSAEGEHLMNLRYIPAARLVYVNSKWRSAKSSGFPLSMTNGIWREKIPPPEEQKEDWRLVKLWTSNTADALFIEPIQPLGLDPNGITTLQYALKRGIELEFQIEPNELGVVAIGDTNAPNILIYEAAEGSLGILSRFTDSPETLRNVVRAAKKICRYDDQSYRAKASYSDLLSYFNQRDHLALDRFAIQNALDKLLACSIEVQTNNNYSDYDSHYQSLISRIDPNSPLERTFLDHLYRNNLRLPDEAQRLVPGIFCQPDFYYDPRIWVFVDGSVHDQSDVIHEDKKKRRELIARGDEVIVYRYDQDLESLVASRPDIFRKIR
jgi:superfamily II DNA/RNA helicase